MTYDSRRGVVVLFGGAESSAYSGPYYLNETWEWNGTDWAQRFPTTAPSQRGAPIAFDSNRGVTVLFGGVDTSGELFDTWEYDGTNWAQRFPAHTPSICCGSMTYDSRRHVVELYGQVYHGQTINALWEYDGNDWTERLPTTTPSASLGSVITYDSARGVTVLYNGEVGSGETWEWDGTNWTQQVTANTPGFRPGYALAYDSVRQKSILFGGLDEVSGSYPGYLNDTWEYSGPSVIPPSVNVPMLSVEPSYEGSPVSASATFTSSNLSGTFSCTVDYGDGTVTVSGSISGNNCVGPAHTYLDIGNFRVTVHVSDNIGGVGANSALHVVKNVPTTVNPISAPLDPVQVNAPITASASFTDPGTLDTHTAIWDWGDGNTSAGTVLEINGSGSVSGGHTYAAAGVYTLKLTVTDEDGGTGQSIYQYVVVYDPNAGFVTGGGWINSPAGAYLPNLTLTGKLNIGFNAKYQKGTTVPTGQTELDFHAANLDFHSTGYQWLVIAGAKAQYKGMGTINGTGNYGFMVTGLDGSLSGGTDKLRIKIWDNASGAVVYDNQMGAADTADPTTPLGGGNIALHS